MRLEPVYLKSSPDADTGDPAAEPARDAATGRPKILCIEPNRAERDRIRELAVRHAVEIQVLPSIGRLMTLSNGHWDGVIVDGDCVSGRGESFEGIRSLRKHLGRNNPPIMVLSSDDDLETRVAAVRAGAHLFLHRPLTSVGLRDCVTASISQSARHPQRVLHIDADVEYLDIIRWDLENDGMAVRSMPSPANLIATLQEFRPHALLLELNPRLFSGIDLCSMLRSSQEWRDLPVFLLASGNDEDSRAAAFAAGCDEFLCKSLDSAELRVRVRDRMVRARLARSYSQLDSLTGLALRHLFLTALEARLSEAERHDTPVALCLLDVDNFKFVNDNHGHLAGDHALERLSSILMHRFRGVDLRCRWGGDEFALALAGSRTDVMHGIMERILHEVTQQHIPAEDGKTFRMSFSGGIAEYPLDATDVDGLLLVADRRLLAAKAAGRSCIHGSDLTGSLGEVEAT